MAASKIHLLDVGTDQYGDCILCEVKGRTVLIDGGHRSDLAGSTEHPSIPSQLASLLGSQDGKVRISLLVVSHAHNDHIGCLPELVEQGIVTADWALLVDPNMAWGHDSDAAGNADALRLATNPTPVDRLVALLREEPRPELTDRVAFEVAAADAVSLQQRYRKMIATLKAGGTKVVRHGTDTLQPLLDAMDAINLKVLGPSKAHIKACRDIIQGIGRDFRADFAEHAASDADIFNLYHAIQQRLQDSADAASRSTGPPINLQSSILVFGDATHRFLFTGDSQLERTEISSETISDSVKGILAEIKANAPYDFVKIGHHGSDNAFGAKLLEGVEGSENFGICTGSDSTHHPHAKTLDLLRGLSAGITWVRTDRNGRSSFTFDQQGDPVVEITHRALNDLTKPGDELAPASLEPQRETLRRAEEPTAAESRVLVERVVAGAAPAPIEIRIPYVPELGARITLQLEIEPHRVAVTSTSVPATASLATESGGDFVLAGGRTLPRLLFVTSESALAGNIGAAHTTRILRSLRSDGQPVLSTLPANARDTSAVMPAISTALQRDKRIEGVVLLGGLDVVPAERRDALPATLRRRVAAESDPDNFIVWSDALYGDSDGDGLPELPVTRIPDGKSAQLMYTALGVNRPAALGNRDGVRNLQREFADPVFSALSGSMRALRRSSPQTHVAPPYQLSGDQVYLMLHGDYRDATRFWGETAGQETVEAVNIDNVAVSPGSIVFAGCCWGALTVEEPAGSVVTGAHVTPRTPANSLALRFLQGGALAFVGCTGVHYSPLEPPYEYFGGPMHRGFWKQVLDRKQPPALALFEARMEYLRGIPTRARSGATEAIERKLFEEFTCLGLGW